MTIFDILNHQVFPTTSEVNQVFKLYFELASIIGQTGYFRFMSHAHIHILFMLKACVRYIFVSPFCKCKGEQL